jgi:hypothetical protein
MSSSAEKGYRGVGGDSGSGLCGAQPFLFQLLLHSAGSLLRVVPLAPFIHSFQSSVLTFCLMVTYFWRLW